MINVFNIEKFATHDGPGIRTTIFLKGCNLHCPWCANPESWSLKPTLMYDLRKCIKCKKCVNACKQKAISFDKKFLYDRLKCIYCKKCSESCLTQALTFAGKKLSINTIVDEVMKDKDYFDNSNGGITISGGEPFVQFEAMMKLIKALKKQNLHIAIETTGNYPLEYLKQALPYLDLLLFDVKHLNYQKIKDVIGGNPKLIFNNLKFLASTCPEKVIIQTPVIPYFNNDEKTLQSIIDLAFELNITNINLLPYHTLGKNKWEQINKQYYLENEKMLEKETLKKYIQYGNDRGINIKIGG